MDKDKLFFVEDGQLEKRTYQEWFERSTATFKPFLFTNNVSQTISNLFVGLFSGQDIYLLDSDFSKAEIEVLIGSFEKTQEIKKVDFGFSTWDELVDKINDSESKITLLTSGTTGNPKPITHTVQTFLRTTRLGEKYKNHVWGLAYNPTHMAGLQVIFQAVLNQNTIVNLFKRKPSVVFEQIEKYKISHLSATPTFYRLLLSDKQQIVQSVKRVTLGGEKSEQELYHRIRKTFLNAKINNIYASTELGALFVSDGETFSIPAHIEDKIKIIENKIQVHNSLLPINQNHLIKDAEWFDTGDLIEIVQEKPLKFKFIGRASSIINIGGYNVNPKEVEVELLKHPAIKIAVVYAKKNRIIGNLLVSDIVLKSGFDLSEKDFRAYLNDKIQAHKIPRIIKIKDNIQLTRTGKTKEK